MDSSLDMICSVDANGIILSMNAACKTILGYTPDELIGKQLFDFLYPEDKEASEQMAGRIMRGIDTTNFENRYVRKDGSLVPLYWTARWDSNRRVRYGVARDATERKKQELQLQLSERRFKSLVQDGSDLIGIIDSEANYIYVSPTVEQILGYHADELIKKNAFDFINPDDRDVVRASLSKINEIKKIVWRHTAL